jgi:hypothetical protein
MKTLYSQLDDHIQQYEKGVILISEDIEFSMHKTVRTITHYILSKYMSGGKDNIDPKTQLRRPFRNIGNAIVDIEWRAKNIDRKSIEGHATDGDYLFSMVVNKELQQWMKDNNFGKVIDDYQRKKSEYGSALLKKTETADELLIEPVRWGTMAVDARDIAGGPKVDRNFLTVLDLKKKAGVWTEADDKGVSGIDAAIAAFKKDKTSKGENRIEVWDIEGEFEYCDVYPESENDNEEIALYNLIVAVVANKKFCLYKTKLTESRFKHDARKAVEGRDLGMGVWEEVFEPQIWTNEAVIAEKEAMDIAGKVVIKSNKKNLPSAMSLVNGEIIELETGEFFDPVFLAPTTLPQFQNQIDNWFINTQRDQSAFPGVTGEEPKASTPMGSLQLQAAQGGSIFNKRRDQDGFFLLEVLVDWVLPFIVEEITKGHKLTASYAASELKQLDEAIRTTHSNKHTKEGILSGKMVLPEHKMAMEADMQAHLDKQGDSRTLYIPKGWITLAKIKEKIRFDITDEMSDDQRRINTLATALGQLPPGDPQRSALVAEMMEIGGVSAASFPVNATAPAPSPAMPTKSTRTNDVLPAGQKV